MVLKRPRRERSLVAAALAAAFLGLGAGHATPAAKLWSVAPVRRPEVPATRGERWTRNPIDAFVLQTLRANGFAPASEADRLTLIRRVAFDLTGLPPTPGEVDAFLHDNAPDAYERLVDRLLASPHYGERWGRHWLDLVRFAETHGYERDDPKPNAWKYRDWVVRVFNRDLPYDRFLVEQLAGDEMPGASAESKTATGIYRLGLVDDEPADPLMDRFDQLDDVVKTVGTTFLGLTIHCARCHDHKFDPITQADYYRLVAFFTPAKRFVRDHNESISIELATPEEKAEHARLNLDVDRLALPYQRMLGALRAPHRKALIAERLQPFDNDTIAAFQTPEDRRDADQKRLAERAAAAVTLKPEEIDARLTPTEKLAKAAIDLKLKKIDAARPAPLPVTLGLTDRQEMPEPVKILMRGDAHRPGSEVAPGFLSVIDPTAPVIEPAPGRKTTGRRLALARWIARAEHPLTARVIVNRLWQHHFGQGIVATPSDFGTMGEAPSHPELLDWLASELVAQGWSLKAMHRLMVTSSTYRQSGQWNDLAAEQDPADSLLWRMAPRRLEAEPIRDAVLATTGALNAAFSGPSITPPIDPAVLAGQSRPGNGWARTDPNTAHRRSLYVYVKRTLPLPELEVLDAPDNADPCPRRSVTTTAPQALMLLNSGFFHEQAGLFADRLVRECGEDPSRQVDRAFLLAFSRPCTDAERRESLAFLSNQPARIARRAKPEDRANPRHEALRAFCLVLLNANEYVTVD